MTPVEPPLPAAPSRVAMTDLDDRLQADDGSRFRTEVLSRLTQLDAELGAMVARGLTRDEFQRAQAVRGAVQAARNFLAKRG